MSRKARQRVSVVLLALSLSLTLPLHAARSRDDQPGDRGLTRIVHRLLRIIRGFGDEMGVPKP